MNLRLEQRENHIQESSIRNDLALSRIEADNGWAMDVQEALGL